MEETKSRQLRTGFTTGTCAAIATKAALKMLILNETLDTEYCITPSGEKIEVPILDIQQGEDYVSCSVKKDSGDDPDVTNGMVIYSQVSLKEACDIEIDGGIGIGRVTKRGLPCSIGEAAINPVPRQMIDGVVRELLDEYEIKCGVKIIISAPEGEEIAKKTFNERMGIVGGISIIGTTGIVEPMSERAIIDTIRAQLKVKRAEGNKEVILIPGNYGAEYMKNTLKIDPESAVVISNYVGEALDMVCELLFDRVLLIGHTGKLFKLAGGIMNTHSHVADCRMEIIGVHAALAGAESSIVSQIMESVSTDEALRVLSKTPYYDRAIDSIMDKILYHVKGRLMDKVDAGIITFSRDLGTIGKIGIKEG